jgi:hypothetical protein
MDGQLTTLCTVGDDFQKSLGYSMYSH